MRATALASAPLDASAHDRSGARAPNPVLVASVVVLVFGWLALQRDFGPDGYFVPWKGFAVLLLGVAPGIRYFARVRRDPNGVEPLPYLPILGVIYGIYYGLPVLVRDQVSFMSLAPSAEAIDEALDLAIAGWIALCVGFHFVAPRLLASQRARPLRIPWDEKRAYGVALVLIGLGLAAQVLAEVATIPAYLVQVVRLVMLLQRLGLGILIVFDLTRGGRGWRRLVLWGVIVPAYLLYYIRAGHIGSVVRPLAFLVFVVWAYRFRLPWMTLGVLAVCVVLLRGAAEEFRSMMWRSSSVSEMSPLERTATYIDIVRRDIMTRPEDTLGRSFGLIASRTAQLGLLAHTTHLTPQAVPYWTGETYRTLASSFVPRFVWRDKPSKNLGQRFGHRYAVLHPSDRSTSVNLPQLVELFINFGPVGASFGMLLLGVLYALAYFKLNHAQGGDGTTLIGAILFSELVNIESDFSLVFGGLLQVAAVLYVTLKYCVPRPGPRVAFAARAGKERGAHAAEGA